MAFLPLSPFTCIAIASPLPPSMAILVSLGILFPSLLTLLPFSSQFATSGLVALSSTPPSPSLNACSTECGPLSNVTFPFSIIGPNMSTTSCGLPEFRIRCNRSISTWWPEPFSMPLSSILSITSNHITSGTFVIVAGPSTFSPPVDACSALQQESFVLHSSSFPQPPLGLQFFPSGNIILLTNCSNDLTRELRVNETVNDFSFSSPRCLDYYSVCSNQSSHVYSTVPCLEAISADANVSLMRESYGCPHSIAIYELPKPENMALSMQISWLISQSYYDCKACEGSNGTCSLNNITGSFQCSCPGYAGEGLPVNVCGSSRTPRSCKGLCRSNVQILIGGTAIGVVIVILGASFGVYYCWCRRARLLQDGGQLQTLMHISSKEQVKHMLAREESAIPDTIIKFSYMELFAATDGFAGNKVLGDGGFGIVYEGTLLCSGEKVAVKLLNSDNARRFEQFLNEIRILSSLEHPNLVRLHGFCCESLSKLLLVYEYACNGTLADNLHGITNKAYLLWETRMSIALETASALAYMHQQDPPILHRDVKSSNILLGEKFHAKLADFGLSRIVYAMRGAAHVSTTPQGTPGYVDPQYQQCHRLTDKSDVYSFGVVLMELLSGKAPIDMSGSHQNDHINLSNLAVAKIQAGALHELIDPVLVQHYSGITKCMHEKLSRVAELAFLCLAPLQEDRPSMSCVALTLLDIAQCSDVSTACSST